MNVCHTEEKNVMIRTEWCLLFFHFFQRFWPVFWRRWVATGDIFWEKKSILKIIRSHWSSSRSMYELELGRSVLRHWNFCTNWFGEAIFARFSFHWHFALAWVCVCAWVWVFESACVRVREDSFICLLLLSLNSCLFITFGNLVPTFSKQTYVNYSVIPSLLQQVVFRLLMSLRLAIL